MSNYRLSSRAVIINGSMILLNEFNNGEYYNLPGGGVEKNETLRKAVAREVLEETGYTVFVKEMLYIYEYNPIRDNYSYGLQGSLSHVFRCTINESANQKPQTEIDNPNDSSICTGCKWIAINELKNIRLVPPINDVIMNDISNSNYTTKFLENIH